MAVERFTLAQFEDALPKTVPVTKLGLRQGEFAFEIQAKNDLLIHIRSSVDSSCLSRDTGEDSIRAWLVDADGNPASSKIQKYVTRVKGWEKRLLVMLRELWVLSCEATNCPVCGIKLRPGKVKNGPNKGRKFVSCPAKLPNGKFAGHTFTWLD